MMNCPCQSLFVLCTYIYLQLFSSLLLLHIFHPDNHDNIVNPSFILTRQFIIVHCPHKNHETHTAFLSAVTTSSTFWLGLEGSRRCTIICHRALSIRKTACQSQSDSKTPPACELIDWLIRDNSSFPERYLWNIPPIPCTIPYSAPSACWYCCENIPRSVLRVVYVSTAN